MANLLIDDNGNEDVCVWEVGLGDYTVKELSALMAGEAHVTHVLALTAADAAQVTQELIFADDGYRVLWVKLVGAYGIRVAPSLALVSVSEYSKRRHGETP
jgi:hypothetical protein